MAKLYKCRPSDILGIVDVYTAYCLDEACAYIISKIQKGEEPDFNIQKESLEKRHYSSLRDMYNSMGFKGGSYTKSLA